MFRGTSPAAVPEASPENSLGRRVFTGAAWITLAGGAGRLFSLFSAPILTTVVPPNDYGVAALVSATTSLATTVALCGIDTSYARHWAGSEAADADVIERFCWRFAMASSALFAIVTAALWLTVPWVRAGASPALALFIALAVPLSVVGTMSQTRARFRRAYRLLAAATILSAAAAAGFSVVLALTWRSDAWALVAGAAVGTMVGIGVLGIPIGPFGIARGISGWKQRAKILEIGVAGMASAGMYWVIISSDRWFIGLYRDPAELGIYSFGGNVAMIGLAFNTAIIATWVPEITIAYERGQPDARSVFGREWARLVAMLLIVWLAVTSAGGDVIHLLAHSRFHDGARYVPWISAAVLFYGIASIANTGLWVSKDMKPSAYWWLVGAAVSLGLNAMLVPRFGALGAAYTSCASFLFIACGTLWSAHRKFALQIPWTRLWMVCLLVLAAGFPMIVVWHRSPLVSLALKFPVGLSTAAVACFIIAPEWARERLARIVGSRSAPGRES